MPYVINTPLSDFQADIQNLPGSAEDVQFLWQSNGTTIVNASNNQYDFLIVDDGQGGAIIVWCDYRSGTHSDIYSQRIYENGSLAWNPNGTAICTIAGNKSNVKMVADGLGGAIIVWSDTRAGTLDIYAQQINATGNVTWTTNGLVICNATGNQKNPTITSDGNHGAIIAWGDGRLGTQIYAQRISNNGNIQWTVNGSEICQTAAMESKPEILYDGNGGAFVVYTHEIFFAQESDLYAQHINSTGNATWNIVGISVSSDEGNQEKYQMILDNSGGIIISYLTTPIAGGNSHVWIQRINSTGNNLWTSNGKQIGFSENGGEDYPQLIEDGQNGAIIAWQDWRRSSLSDIYGQRVNSNGECLWEAAGQVINNNSNSRNPNQMRLHTDYNNGAILLWQENRSTSDIMIQRINQNGQSLWEQNGKILCNIDNIQDMPTINTNGRNGIIIAWNDNRGTTMADIVAQQISIPPPLAPIFSSLNITDIDGNYTVSWSIQLDAFNYTLYRFSSPIVTFNSSITEIGVFSSSEYLESGMNEGVYYYAVIATNNLGNSSLSKSLLVVIDMPGPDTPILMAFNPNPDTDGNITLNWNDVLYANNYTIYKYSEVITSDNMNSAIILKSGLISSEYVESGLCNGTYYYAIRANNDTGMSSLSNSEAVVISIFLPTNNTNSNTSPNENNSPNSPLEDFPWWIVLVIGGVSIVIYLGKKKSNMN